MQKEIEDGGTAFPCDAIYRPINAEPIYGGSGGMSLRDYFAGQALIALPHIGCGADLMPLEVAQAAYQIADRMIEMRNGGKK